MVSRRGSAIVTTDRALHGNFILAVNSDHVSSCSGLAEIFNGKFQDISDRISEMAYVLSDYMKIIDLG